MNSLQEFEDLDEITARYIQPMASFARDLLGHKYFQDGLWGIKEVCFFTPMSFFTVPHLIRLSLCLFFSLIENGGVIGQDKAREAYFHPILPFGM